MEHIIEKYGSETNLLKMKTKDFDQLRRFLEALGVQIRICEEYNGECVIQGRNFEANRFTLPNY